MRHPPEVLHRSSGSAGMARVTGLVAGAASDADGLLGLARHGEGRVAVYGDSGCLDSSHQRSPCYGLLQALLAYVATVSRSANSSERRNVLMRRTPRSSRTSMADRPFRVADLEDARGTGGHVGKGGMCHAAHAQEPHSM